METLKVNIKKIHKNAVIPTYSKVGDCGMDLTAIAMELNYLYKYIEYDTGLGIELPKGYVGLIFPRSSISNKMLSLCNSTGILDENYRGSIKLRMRYNDTILSPHKEHYGIGDRIGQLIIMPYPKIEFNEVSELNETNRGDKGFGSSGR